MIGKHDSCVAKTLTDQAVYYFSYMAIASLLFGLMTGAIGVIASFGFIAGARCTVSGFAASRRDGADGARERLVLVQGTG